VLQETTQPLPQAQVQPSWPVQGGGLSDDLETPSEGNPPPQDQNLSLAMSDGDEVHPLPPPPSRRTYMHAMIGKSLYPFLAMSTVWRQSGHTSILALTRNTSLPLALTLFKWSGTQRLVQRVWQCSMLARGSVSVGVQPLMLTAGMDPSRRRRGDPGDR